MPRHINISENIRYLQNTGYFTTGVYGFLVQIIWNISVNINQFLGLYYLRYWTFASLFIRLHISHNFYIMYLWLRVLRFDFMNDELFLSGPITYNKILWKMSNMILQ